MSFLGEKLSCVLRRCISLYLVAGLLIFMLVDQDRIVAKSLDYESVGPSFLAEFAKNQDSSFFSPRAEETLRYYKNLIRMYPDSPYAFAALAFSYYHYGNNQKAIRYYKKAISLKSDVFGFYYNLSILYIKEKMYDDALEVLQKAVTTSPDSTVHYPYAIVPSLESNNDLNQKDNFLNLKQSFDKCFEMLIFLHWLKKDYQSMFKIAQERFDSSSLDQWKYFYYAGLAHVELKQYVESLKFLRRASELNPENQTIYRLIIKVLNLLKLKDVPQIQPSKTSDSDGESLSAENILPKKLIYYVPLKPIKSNGKSDFIMI